MTFISKYHLSYHVATIRKGPHTKLVYDTCETGTGQQVAQLHERYMMMMMMM